MRDEVKSIFLLKAIDLANEPFVVLAAYIDVVLSFFRSITGEFVDNTV